MEIGSDYFLFCIVTLNHAEMSYHDFADFRSGIC